MGLLLHDAVSTGSSVTNDRRPTPDVAGGGLGASMAIVARTHGSHDENLPAAGQRTMRRQEVLGCQLGGLARAVWGTDPSVFLEAMGIAPVLQRDGGKAIP